MQSHRLAFCVCQAVCFACLSVLRGGIALASIIHSTLAPSTDLGKFLHISEGQCFAHEQPRSLRSAPRMHCHSAADAFADTDRMGTGGWLSTSDSFIWYVFPPGFCHSVSLSLSFSLFSARIAEPAGTPFISRGEGIFRQRLQDAPQEGEQLGIALPMFPFSCEQCLANALHPTKQSLRKKGEPFALLCLLPSRLESQFALLCILSK